MQKDQSTIGARAGGYYNTHNYGDANYYTHKNHNRHILDYNDGYDNVHRDCHGYRYVYKHPYKYPYHIACM
jgi:hypothetical protein